MNSTSRGLREMKMEKTFHVVPVGPHADLKDARTFATVEESTEYASEKQRAYVEDWLKENPRRSADDYAQDSETTDFHVASAQELIDFDLQLCGECKCIVHAEDKCCEEVY